MLCDDCKARNSDFEIACHQLKNCQFVKTLRPVCICNFMQLRISGDLMYMFYNSPSHQPLLVGTRI